MKMVFVIYHLDSLHHFKFHVYFSDPAHNLQSIKIMTVRRNLLNTIYSFLLWNNYRFTWCWTVVTEAFTLFSSKIIWQDYNKILKYDFHIETKKIQPGLSLKVCLLLLLGNYLKSLNWRLLSTTHFFSIFINLSFKGPMNGTIDQWCWLIVLWCCLDWLSIRNFDCFYAK